MQLEAAISMLRRHEAELKSRGIRHAAVFGSVARATERTDSDVDILIDLDAGLELDVFGYVAIRQLIADVLQEPVDVVNRAFVKKQLSAAIERDAVYAF